MPSNVSGLTGLALGALLLARAGLGLVVPMKRSSAAVVAEPSA
jgi:hypothetical protein